MEYGERIRVRSNLCKCTFSQHVLGDGCDICNPAKALEYARERIAEMESALQLIAAPKRPDGTWNRDREAVRQLAQDALDGK